MDNKQKISLFSNELNDIQDKNLREFAVNLILSAPEYFFTVPASSSGKYHPYFAREVGGLVKHTRCVVFYSECNAESFDFSTYDKDLLIIAALCHDIKKQGDNNYGKHTVWEHPELASNYILEMQEKYPKLITKEDANKIANAIICHMGKWANKPEFTKGKKSYPMPNTIFEYALQSADYIASRKELTGFEFRETNDTLLVEEQIVKPEKNIGDEIFTFGKHSGKTIKEVVENHKDYIDWMLNKANFNNSDMLEKIKEYMKNKK